MGQFENQKESDFQTAARNELKARRKLWDALSRLADALTGAVEELMEENRK